MCAAPMLDMAAALPIQEQMVGRGLAHHLGQMETQLAKETSQALASITLHLHRGNYAARVVEQAG